MKLVYALKHNPSPRPKSPIYNPIDLNTTQFYAPLGTNKQRTWAINREYFGYGKKKYI